MGGDSVVGVSRTPSQTVGPFFHIGMPRQGDELAVPRDTPGAFWLRGRVIDGAGDAVTDAVIETWLPGSDGAFGRSATDEQGRYAIFTRKPAATGTDGGSVDAPHLEVIVFARGLLRHLVTRVYFGDEQTANARDPLLASIDDAARRATLIAARSDDGYVFDIRLQGEGETVFFDI
jgi:protocatechuate 3,4-dioxygenase alpha subunit